MKRIILLFIATIMIISCTKKDTGIKTYFNNSTPANPDFNIEIVEQDTLQNDSTRMFFDMPWDAVEDTDGNIFILSLFNGKIVKYDNSFNYITDFGGKGNGPGELSSPQSMFVYKDTLFVTDSGTKKISKYITDGHFVNSTFAPILSKSHTFTRKNNYFISQSIDFYEKENVMVGRSNLTLIDNRLNLIKNIVYGAETEDFIFFKSRISYAMTDNNIYVAENRTDRYKINIFDYSGKKTGIINKDYAMIPFEYKKEIWSKFFGSKYKRIISNLYTDYNDNIWVMKAQKDAPDADGYRVTLKFDVFKNGEFINEVTLDSLYYESYNYGLKTKVVNNRIFSFYGAEDKVIVSRYIIKD
ncbi:MAG: hypothetical protein PF638_02750 [Candidatus Delongbacteria bacterium]|jgi:hypothetical protein|nr:hypothetical protein [Candidatus Delongbacteria bacterium]